MLDEVLETDPGDGGLTVLLAAGDAADGAYACAECGYGVTLKTELPPCPMCGGGSWEARN